MNSAGMFFIVLKFDWGWKGKAGCTCPQAVLDPDSPLHIFQSVQWLTGGAPVMELVSTERKKNSVSGELCLTPARTMKKSRRVEPATRMRGPKVSNGRATISFSFDQVRWCSDGVVDGDGGGE